MGKGQLAHQVSSNSYTLGLSLLSSVFSHLSRIHPAATILSRKILTHHHRFSPLTGNIPPAKHTDTLSLFGLVYSFSVLPSSPPIFPQISSIISSDHPLPISHPTPDDPSPPILCPLLGLLLISLDSLFYKTMTATPINSDIHHLLQSSTTESIDSFLGVSLFGLYDTVLLAALSTSFALIVGLVLLFWKKSSDRGANDLKSAFISNKALSAKTEEEEEEDAAASGNIKVTVFYGTQTGTAESFAMLLIFFVVFAVLF